MTITSPREKHMNEVYESIKRGLEEAIAYQQGKKSGAKIHKVPVVVVRKRRSKSESAK